MPYSRVSRTPSGEGAIAYARYGHAKRISRNEYVTTVNMLPDGSASIESQMRPVWAQASPQHTTRIDRFIVSFSRKEIDPEDPEGAVKAGAICRDLAKLLCNGFDPENPDHKELAGRLGFDPDTFSEPHPKSRKVRNLSPKGRHQAAVFIQKDGHGGLLHGHILVNDVAMDTGAGLNPCYYWHDYLRQMTDFVAEKYIDLDIQDEHAPDKARQTVRVKRQQNAEIEKRNAAELAQASAEDRAPILERTSYIWKDDMKGRIKDAASESKDENEFIDKCSENGVLVAVHESAKRGKYYTYELADTSLFEGKVPANLKARSYKMGDDYGPEGVMRSFGHGKSVPAPEPVPEPSRTPEPARDPMETAEGVAKHYAYLIYAESKGWSDADPVSAVAKVERHREANAVWEEFKDWRSGIRKTGYRLPAIYLKDRTTGSIRVRRDAMEEQYRMFLFPEPEAVPEATEPVINAIPKMKEEVPVPVPALQETVPVTPAPDIVPEPPRPKKKKQDSEPTLDEAEPAVTESPSMRELRRQAEQTDENTRRALDNWFNRDIGE